MPEDWIRMLGKRKRGGGRGGYHSRSSAFSKIKPVDEVTFDTAERHAFLTGFHKRKQARIKYAQEQAAKQDREDRIQQRKELREDRRREVEEHLRAVRQAQRKLDGLSSESEESGNNEIDEANEGNGGWSGIQDDIAGNKVDREDQYSGSDEEEEATVTVEAVDITRDGFTKASSEDEDEDKDEDGTTDKAVSGLTDASKDDWKRHWTKERPSIPKKKRKKFRYESLAERRQSRALARAVKAKKRAKRKGE